MSAENALREAHGAMARQFVYVSELLARLVETAEGAVLGKLSDLKIKLGEPFPKVISLAFKKHGIRGSSELDWKEVRSLTRHTVDLKPGAETRFRPLEVGNDEILLREELLDKQVVDTFGAKIERVNDIHLLIVNQDLRVVHINYGFRGILRRLGWLRGFDLLTQWLFAYRSEEKMISWKYIQPLLSDPVKRNLKLNVTARKIHEIHPSDLADIIEELDRVNRSTIFRSLDLQTAAQTLEEVEDPKLQASLIESAPTERASDILEEMAPDEATDLLADLSEERKERLIRTMDKPSREAIEELLQFKEGTAGSIMTKDFLSVWPDKTVGETIDEFRRTTYPLDSVSYIYVVDKDNRLLGVSTLRHLIICEKDQLMSRLMNTHLITVEPEERIKDVAVVFKKYKFMALPVVDEDGVLKGLITLKDILQSELEE
jgi:magnesium transporter